MPSNLIQRLHEACGTDNLAEVARMTGVPYNTLKNYSGENKRMPSSEVLVQIARSINVNLNWLLLGRGRPFDGGESTQVGNNSSQSGRGEKMLDIEIPSFHIRVKIGDSQLGPDDDANEDLPLYIATDASDTIEAKVGEPKQKK